MEFATGLKGCEREIVGLFTATFAASEGADEGALIGSLVHDLPGSTTPEDIRVFTSRDNGALTGVAVFTRLTCAGDPRTVFLLSPMAVATGRQGKGIGHALLGHALAGLPAQGVDVAMTCGDRAFYGTVGFMPVSETTVPAPLPLSHPEGWMGQSLTGAELTPLGGPCTCVAALNDPALW